MLLHAPDVLIADSGREVDDDVEDNDDDGDDLYIIGAVRLSVCGSQKSIFPPDDLSRPCRPKASQGLLIIMMIAMTIMIVMMVILMIMMKNYQKIQIL